MRLLSIPFIFTIIFTTATWAQRQTLRAVNTYRNPVIAGDFADPSVIRVEDTYYAAGTSSEWGPAYPIYSSKNLVDWEYVGPVFAEIPEWTMGSFWAPELFYHNDTFYCYYTARRKSDKQSYIGVATTKDLKKGFTDHGLIIEWTTEAIDAYVVEDKGKLYITWKAYGLDKGKTIELLGAELSPDGLKVTGKAFNIITANKEDWEAGGAEGQCIFKRGKYWYMLYSGNSCCGSKCNYMVGVARAEKIQGPWIKYAGNPILVSDDVWKCPGHGTVVTTPDNRYFYLHHAYSAADFTFVGRQGVLTELVWNKSTKWPVFRFGKTTPQQANSPAGTSIANYSGFNVDFSQPIPNLRWVHDVRLPKPDYTVKDGSLQIENSNLIETGNFIGFNIKKGSYTFMVEVAPKDELMQSIVIYGDAKNALGYGVRKNMVEVWRVKDGVHETIKTLAIASGKDIALKLHSYNGRFYEFSYEFKGEKPDAANKTVEVDNLWLPRWDRAARVGVNVSGKTAGKGEIKAMQLKYE
ncbi:glycoside hydrolase family 43 protein [Emticicia sp. BO119]|uniref:glycoside hydrolase family 43 protein n=1 Tax=Emticicia sp. BO119 TaxID=2757768 RepID=UPI0015EFFA8F|nr:glycoside hydrolase family 43 protein [Emticicia sp. BO119]MBA4849381.1 family 43 glycosylhydrolase [Emticicia sp. BO119]